MTLDTKAIREHSLIRTGELGYPTNPALPLVDEPGGARNEVDTTARLLALYVCVAHSFGFAADRARAWLAQEDLDQALSPSEARFLNGRAGKATRVGFQFQVEALWALGWASSFHDRLDFGRVCEDSFIKLFPDLKTEESSSQFRSGAQMRNLEALVQQADLAYCLHWAIRGCQFNKQPVPGKLQARVVEERRRALEWLIGTDDWDDVQLDT